MPFLSVSVCVFLSVCPPPLYLYFSFILSFFLSFILIRFLGLFSFVQVRGELTKGENIADVGGLSLSFDAYKMWSQRRIDEGGEAEKPLPGIPLNIDQTFFVSYAQVI